MVLVDGPADICDVSGRISRLISVVLVDWLIFLVLVDGPADICGVSG